MSNPSFPQTGCGLMPNLDPSGAHYEGHLVIVSEDLCTFCNVMSCLERSTPYILKCGTVLYTRLQSDILDFTQICVIVLH